MKSGSSEVTTSACQCQQQRAEQHVDGNCTRHADGALLAVEAQRPVAQIQQHVAHTEPVVERVPLRGEIEPVHTEGTHPRQQQGRPKLQRHARHDGGRVQKMCYVLSHRGDEDDGAHADQQVEDERFLPPTCVQRLPGQHEMEPFLRDITQGDCVRVNVHDYAGGRTRARPLCHQGAKGVQDTGVTPGDESILGPLRKKQ
eukprot:3223892-Rhodomonas_salina.2